MACLNLQNILESYFFLLNLRVVFFFFFFFLLLGIHAASLARKWVHTFGVSKESAEEGTWKEDALQGLQYDRLVRTRPPLPQLSHSVCDGSVIARTSHWHSLGQEVQPETRGCGEAKGVMPPLLSAPGHSSRVTVLCFCEVLLGVTKTHKADAIPQFTQKKHSGAFKTPKNLVFKERTRGLFGRTGLDLNPNFDLSR